MNCRKILQYVTIALTATPTFAGSLQENEHAFVPPPGIMEGSLDMTLGVASNSLAALFGGKTEAMKTVQSTGAMKRDAALAPLKPERNDSTEVMSESQFLAAFSEACLIGMKDTKIYYQCDQLRMPSNPNSPIGCFCSIFTTNRKLFCDRVIDGVYASCKLQTNLKDFTNCFMPLLENRTAKFADAWWQQCGLP